MNEIHASKFARVYACPASWKLEQEYPNESSEAAERGSLLHKVMEQNLNYADAKLTDEEIEAIEFVKAKLAEIKSKYEVECEINEMPLKGDFRDFTLSGRIDKVIVYKPTGYGYRHVDIIDYKFGHVSVEDAQKNMQLASYAALYALNNPKKGDINVHIIAPFAIGNRYSVAAYPDNYVIDSVLPALKDRMRLVFLKNPPFAKSVGDYCRFCKAKANCPVQKQNIETLPRHVPERFEITVDNAVDIYNRLEEWNKRKLQAEKFIDAIRYGFEQYCETSGDDRFLKKQGAIMKKYDIMAVYSYFKNIIPVDKFLTHCKPSLGNLFKLAASITGKTEKSEKQAFEEAIDNTDACEVSYKKSQWTIKK